MGKAYSQDLRLRVLAAVDSGQSKLSIHRTLGISRSTIDNWLARRAQTGAVLPKVRAASARRAITHWPAFESFAQRHCHATLGQMRVLWEQENGPRLSINTFSRALRHLGWTRKKRVSSTPNARRSRAPSSSSN